MFKINIYLKFALIAISFIMGVVSSILWGFGYSWIFFLIGLSLLASYFLLGTVQSASEMLQDMDFDGAEKRLNLTYFPRLLYVTNRAFYYILKGSFAAQKKNDSEAEQYFNQALSLKLPSDNEKGMVLLQMAGIHAKKNNWSRAKKIMYDAEKLKITEPQLKDQLKQVKMAIDNRGQMKAAQSMGMRTSQMMPGGKRRGPRPR